MAQPVASYIFPAGGRRGTAVDVRVGGLDLHKSCNFEMLGPGVKVTPKLERRKTTWFEGPLLPLPESQQQEDYPKDMAGRVELDPKAALGDRVWRLWASQGATPGMRFVVGDLPEVVEDEIEGDPIPVPVKMPVTVNGRIFPREDVDVWSFEAKKGQSVTARVMANRIGSPLDAKLEILDANGKVLVENDDALGSDPGLRFVAPADGRYQVRIQDVNMRGGQAYVYRLTLTSDPFVDRVYPLGGRRGTKTKFTLAGQGVSTEPVEVAIPADAPTVFPYRDGVLLDVDDLPEHLETEPNEEPGQVKPIEVPAVANGRIEKAGAIDFWAVALKKGEAWEFELRAARLGSPVSGVLAICDATGKELSRGEGDAILKFTAPADGMFLVRVADGFRSRGGADYAYRLRIAKPATPGFRLLLGADAVTVQRNGQGKLRIQAERTGGFNGPITLTLDGLPAGVTATNTTIAQGQAAVEIALKPDAGAKIQAGRVTVRGSAMVADKPMTAVALMPAPRGQFEADSVLVAVALPTPFKIVGDYDMRWASRGGVHSRHYRIERNGFTGPIEVSLGDKQARHLQGVTGPTITVPASASEFDYEAFYPPWMDLGRTSRTCVTGVGVVKDADGTEHTVSFTSVQQNEQIVAVIEPGRLGVETAKATLRAEAGKSVELPIRVARSKGLTGSVKVELVLAPHMHGMTAEPVTIAPDQEKATMTLRFGPSPGPFNMKVLVRATLMDRGKPVVAEASLEMVPPR